MFVVEVEDKHFIVESERSAHEQCWWRIQCDRVKLMGCECTVLVSWVKMPLKKKRTKSCYYCVVTISAHFSGYLLIRPPALDFLSAVFSLAVPSLSG